MLTNQKPHQLSIIMPCFNEATTLRHCVEQVVAIQDDHLVIELVLVDDCSTDASYQIACDLAKTHMNIQVCQHSVN